MFACGPRRGPAPSKWTRRCRFTPRAGCVSRSSPAEARFASRQFEWHLYVDVRPGGRNLDRRQALGHARRHIRMSRPTHLRNPADDLIALGVEAEIEDKLGRLRFVGLLRERLPAFLDEHRPL